MLFVLFVFQRNQLILTVVLVGARAHAVIVRTYGGCVWRVLCTSSSRVRERVYVVGRLTSTGSAACCARSKLDGVSTLSYRFNQ